jgi:hypothetical protein
MTKGRAVLPLIASLKIEDFLSQTLPDDKINEKTFTAISAWGSFCIG